MASIFTNASSSSSSSLYRSLSTADSLCCSTLISSSARLAVSRISSLMEPQRPDLSPPADPRTSPQNTRRIQKPHTVFESQPLFSLGDPRSVSVFALFLPVMRLMRGLAYIRHTDDHHAQGFFAKLSFVFFVLQTAEQPCKADPHRFRSYSSWSGLNCLVLKVSAHASFTFGSERSLLLRMIRRLCF